MFTRRFTASLAGTTLTAAEPLGLAALGLAGTAGASTADDTLNVRDQGRRHHAAEQRAISEAHAACSALDAGQSSKQVIAGVAQRTGLSSSGAHTFAVDAASAYCPQYVTTT